MSRQRSPLPPGASARPMVVGPERLLAKLAIGARMGWLAHRASGGLVNAARDIRALLRYRRHFRHDDATRKYVRAGARYFWDLYAPGFPSLAFDNYITQELQRVRDPGAAAAPSTVVLAITRRCPLACQHCCEWQTLNQEDPVSVADWARIAREFAALGTSQFFLSGGEPLYRLDAVQAVLGSVAAQADVWLLSSGVGLSPRRAAELKEAGLTGIVFSLDHHDASEHDRFRGLPKSFDAVVRGAELVRQVELAVGVALVPSVAWFVAPQQAPPHLARYRELATELGAGFIQILEPKAVGRYAGAEVTLGTAQQRVLEDFTRETTFGRGHDRAPIVAHPDAVRRETGCLAGDRYVYVDTAGVVHRCPFCRGGVESGAAGLDIAGTMRRLRARGCPRDAPDESVPGVAEAALERGRGRLSLPMV